MYNIDIPCREKILDIIGVSVTVVVVMKRTKSQGLKNAVASTAHPDINYSQARLTIQDDRQTFKSVKSKISGFGAARQGPKSVNGDDGTSQKM